MPDENATLAELIAQPPMRETVIEDCAELVDGEVRQKGLLIKGAYRTVKAIKPGFVTGTVDALLDEWLEKLEPYHSKWSSSGSGTLTEYLTARSDDVAEDLLSVTDERAANTKHKTAAKLYKKLRSSAKKNVAAAVPKLAAVLEKRLEEAKAAPAVVEESA